MNKIQYIPCKLNSLYKDKVFSSGCGKRNMSLVSKLINIKLITKFNSLESSNVLRTSVHWTRDNATQAYEMFLFGKMSFAAAWLNLQISCRELGTWNGVCMWC